MRSAMDRLTSASLRDTLDRLGPAIATGCVNVISVEAIRERSDGRWLRKKDQVDEFVERAFARQAGAGDMVLALNEVEFLTVRPDVSKAAAVNLSTNLLREVLTFFLGAAAREDLRVFQVSALVEGRLTVEPVDAAHLPDAGGATTSGQTVAQASTSTAPLGPIKTASRSPPRLVTCSGVAFSIVVDSEPVWNVGDGVVTSFRVRTHVLSAAATELQEGAGPPELGGDVALAAVAYAVEELGGSNNRVRVGLHVPLPLSALTVTASRYRLLHALQAVEPAQRRLLLLEITDLYDGFPQSRLTELVSLLAPYARGVLARAPSNAVDLRPWRHCRLSGVTLDCATLAASDRGAHLRLAAFAKSAREVASACVGYGLSSQSLMLAAWAAGFTHLTGRVISAEAIAPGSAVRLTPADLYASRAAHELKADAPA